jgi:hypothetical protein
MSIRPILASAIFTALVLCASAATACPFGTSAQSDPVVVAASDPSAQPGPATPTPPNPN